MNDLLCLRATEVCVKEKVYEMGVISAWGTLLNDWVIMYLVDDAELCMQGYQTPLSIADVQRSYVRHTRVNLC